MTKLCYVTAFLDINRGEWTNFQRSFEDYLKAFLPYVDLFRNNRDQECEMIVYLDDRHYDRVREVVDTDLPIMIIKINEEWLSENFVMWNRLDREQAIMDSDEFKRLVGARIKYPECRLSKYTMINHSKIEFICNAMKYSDAEFLCWSDFGYFMNPFIPLPHKFVDINKLDKDRINYTMINPLEDVDRDMYQTLRNANERFGGFWFAGRRDKLLEYKELYQDTHLWAQNHNLVDDDQGLLTQIFANRPSLFALHVLWSWHLALLYFQQD